MAASPTRERQDRARTSPTARLPQPSSQPEPAPGQNLAAAVLARAPGEPATLLGLVLLTLLAEWPLLNGRVVTGLDSLTQFIPWYELLGATLREGRLPGWNPFSFAGAPLAANPLTGWTYLPAMLAFTFLPVAAATISFQLFHMLLATLATYALARTLGLGRIGAALAAIAYSQSGLLTLESTCCFAFSSVGAWLPALLLGAELAIRATSWQSRVRGWSLAALALSQIAASWPGQGTYYTLLVFTLFVLLRVIFRVRRPADFGWLVLHGVVPVTFGLALAAAGLLPRAELQALSSLAGGYAAEDLNVGGWTPSEWLQLIEPGFWYAGLGVVGLALAAPVLAWRWRPLLGLVGIGGLLLSLALPTPNAVSDLFGLLPGFAKLHPHLPDRIITVFMLVPALLAGASVDRLARGRLGAAIGLLLLAAVFADLRLAREQAFLGYGAAEGVHRLLPADLSRYYASAPAARFLQERLRTDGPARYFGYDPDPHGLAYTQRFNDPAVLRLGVNNRGVSDRLLDVQGYDAVHLARFDEWLRQANGREQNYHNADLFAEGLRSPLLDVLAARYVVVASSRAGSPADPALADPALALVYDDGETRVLENREALPWAWVAHEARAASAEEARDQIQRGAVDPRRTALLEPPLRSPFDLWPRGGSETAVPTLSGGAATATAAVTLFEADRLVISAASEADGVLVLSEVAHPGWQATIDGRPTPIFVANGLLRAIEMPPGDHIVELRFESPTLRFGIAVSAVAMAVMAVAVSASFVRRVRPPAA